MEEIKTNRPPVPDDEIDLVEVALRLWKGRRVIGLFVLAFLVAGGMWLGYKKITVVPEYTSKTVLYIDSPQPEVIPALVSGAAFLGKLMEVTLTDPATGQPVTVREVLGKHHKPPQGSLAGRISAAPGKAGVFDISATMQHPALAQQLADSVASRFSGFLTAFTLQRKSQGLQYLENRYRDADAAYRQSLADLSGFYHLNPGNAAKRDTIAEKRLRAESDLKYDVLSELAIQLEKERIREQADMPVIRIIDPASVAAWSNQAGMTKVLAIMFFLGITVGVAWVLGKEYVVKLRSEGKA